MSCPECAELRELVTSQSLLIAKLQARIEQLEEQLGRNSSNSSKPPSSDARHGARKVRKKGSGRKKGGQLGRTGASRELLEEVDHVFELVPTECAQCGNALEGEDKEPWRHQVTELPRIEPVVTEYRRHGLVCPCCGRKTHARLPDGAGLSSFGPRLTAFVGMLSGGFGLTKRKIQTLLAEAFGVRISLGSVPRLESRVSGALEKPVEEAHKALRGQKLVWADETQFLRYELEKARGFLWILAGKELAVFSHTISRASHHAKNLIGSGFRGVLHSDRYAAYDEWPDENRQLCLAHLIRNFQAIATRSGRAGEIGAALLAKMRSLIHQFHRFERGELAESTMKAYASRHRVDIRLLLEEGKTLGPGNRTAGTCRKVLEHEGAMYTFVRRLDLGVHPTNNHAERLLRSAVIWRKNSFGTYSETGSLFLERILSAVSSLRLQGRDTFAWLCKVTADFFRAAPPSLSLLPPLP